MCTHLARIGSTYYFRMAVPQELRRFVLTKTGKPRAEFMESLGTKDRDDAKRLLPDRVKLAHAELDEARLRLAQETAQEASGEPASDDFIARAAEARAATEALLEAQRKRRAEREPERQQIRALLNFSTAELGPREAAIRDVILERAERMADPTPAPIEPRRGDAVPLLELFDSYATGAGVKPNTARDWRKVMDKLIKYLGHDDAKRITEADLRGWRDVLLKVPDEKGNVRSPKTVAGSYITAVRATLQWGVDEGKLPGNAAAAVKVRMPKAAKLRESQFTPDEVSRILAAAMIPASEKMAAGHRLARRWIPWLLAYTGARVNELSQLRAEDVQQVDGIWSLLLTPEAGTVKDNQARLVPLHAHLIEQGFLDVVKAQGSGPLFYDPESKRTESDANRHFKKVGERLATWVRDDVGITDKAVQPNHAWRHLFKSNMVRLRVEGRVADAIQGHAPRSAGESYGSVPLEAKKAAIDKLPRFEVG